MVLSVFFYVCGLSCLLRVNFSWISFLFVVDNFLFTVFLCNLVVTF